MKDIGTLLRQWDVDERGVRERMYRSATPRERERWHALWLISRGWSEARVGEALERDPHTIGEWLHRFETEGPAGMAFEQTGGSPPPSMKRLKLR
jgi:transposase